MKYSLSIEYLSSLDFESPNPGKNLANGEHAWMVAEDWLLGDMAHGVTNSMDLDCVFSSKKL